MLADGALPLLVHGGASRMTTEDTGRLSAPERGESLTECLRQILQQLLVIGTAAGDRCVTGSDTCAGGVDLLSSASASASLHSPVIQLAPRRSYARSQAVQAAASVARADIYLRRLSDQGPCARRTEMTPRRVPSPPVRFRSARRWAVPL